MKLDIWVNYHTMPRNLDSLSHFLKSIKFKKNTMLFFSKDCYEFIKNNSQPLGETIMPFFAKSFVKTTRNGCRNDYFSFIPIYSGEWFYLEDICSQDINFNYICDLPTEIKFVSFENEFFAKKVNVNVTRTADCQNPLTCIIDDYSPFKNSFLILTKDAFEKLRNSIDIISYHKGFYRLRNNSDEFYSGGTIMVKVFNISDYYLIESMEFPSFNKKFTVKGFPNAIHFIIE